MRRPRLLSLLACAAIAPTILASQRSAPPVTPEMVVTAISGIAPVATNGTSRKELRVLDRIADGSMITVRAGALIYLVATPSGRRWRAEGDTVITIEAGQVRLVRGRLVELEPVAVPAAVAAIRLDDLGRLQIAGTRVRGGSDLSPNGAVLADLDHVELVGAALPGVRAYRIRLADLTADGAEVLSVLVPAVGGTVRFPLPSGVLLPGRSYLWQAMGEGEAGAASFLPVREARFDTLAASDMEVIETFRRQMDRSTAPDLVFLLAAFEASHGLGEEACRLLNDRGLLAREIADLVGCIRP